MEHHTPHHTPHNAQHPESDAPPATDPVCGMKVLPTSAHRHTAADGTQTVFCSARCRERFVSDPTKYQGALEHEPSSAPAKEKGAGVYTCPMHPEIRSDGPGACPKCGMALEPTRPAADEEESHELRDMKRRFWFAAALTVPLLVLSMGDMLPGQPISRLLSTRRALCSSSFWRRRSAPGRPGRSTCGRSSR